MDKMSATSLLQYRRMVYEDPRFEEYFPLVTPVHELGTLNIGSRPAKRKTGGITAFRAIPWIFAWTQVRLLVPIWLGLGTAIKQICDEGDLPVLKDMYQTWPFIRSFFDLISMVLVKSNLEISAAYEKLLVPAHLHSLGEELRSLLSDTIRYVSMVTDEKHLLDNDKLTLRAVSVRSPWITPCNVVQMICLSRYREGDTDPALLDALQISIKAIAAGLQNTG